MTAGMATLVAGASLSPFFLVEGAFASGTVRLWTGIGPLSWGGETWQGGGDLLEVSAIEETTGTDAAGLAVSLSGIPSELLAIALGEHYQGRSAKLWLGALDDTGAIVADPLLLFTGRMDVMPIDEGPETSRITVTAENRLIDLKRTRELRYTDAAQKALFPGDRGFEFVAGLQDKQIEWGQR